MVRKLLRPFRPTADRLLHPWRRRRACRAIAAFASRYPTGRVLFVCLGNVCRSPYAAARLRRLLPEMASRIDSAGFLAGGRTAPSLARQVAGERGLSLDGHRSQQLDGHLVRGTTLVVTMTYEQANRIARHYRLPEGRVLVLGDLDPHAIDARSIRDPEQHDAEVFRDVYGRIDDALWLVALALAKGGGPSAD